MGNAIGQPRPEAREFFGLRDGEFIDLMEAVERMTRYIEEHNLLLPDHLTLFRPDERLGRVLGTREVTEAFDAGMTLAWQLGLAEHPDVVRERTPRLIRTDAYVRENENENSDVVMEQ